MGAEAQAETEAVRGASTLEGGNYEVIRARLLEQATELARRADALNALRKETFGGQELAVVATERIRTENNCLPIDIVEIGGRLLVGFNVFIGLKSETSVADVLSLFRFDPRDGGYDCSVVGHEEVHGFLQDAQFCKDFTALYKYSRDAQLLQLVTTDTRLFAVFQVGSTYRETKVFRWAIEANGVVRYLDDRGEREYERPRQHAFAWETPAPGDQIDGRYVDVADLVFVSTTDGRLRLSVEDNTREGQTVLVEPVEDRNQGISDALLRYAKVGHLVVLEILPYREEKRRYFVFNAKTKSAVRLDAIGQACVALPEDHGLVFPGGSYLESGEHKVFDGDVEGLEFHRKIASPNGEDVLFLFYDERRGSYALFPYNLIRKEIETPIRCGGYSLFDDGRLVVFRDETEPTRVHPMQIWQTPFTSAEHAAAAPTDGSFLAKVGNADLVRGVSDALSLCRLARNDAPTRQTFEDLIAGSRRMLDAHHWLGRSETLDLKSVVVTLRDTTESIIDEFEKLLAFRRDAEKALAGAEARFQELGRDLRPEHWRKVEPFLEGLAKLRMLRGQVITLRELRGMELAKLGELEGRVVARYDDVSKACVQFLLREDALAPLVADLEALSQAMPKVAKSAEVRPHKEKLDLVAEGLALLGEVIGNLPIDDATQRTRILEGLSVVFGQLNRTRAVVEGRRKELASTEGRAEIVVQLAVLGQAVSSSLGLADTPEKCDAELSRLLVQLEELEGRFSDVDELSAELAGKRDELHEAFAAKKQALLDAKNRRIQSLATAAERVLEGIARRGRSQKTVDELNAYFASDAMVLKLRQLADELQALGDSVKADAFVARLLAARQDALRGLRDKLDLFEGEGELIKLGRHRFSVNTQALELTIVPHAASGDGADGSQGLAFHLTGTDYYQPVLDPGLDAAKRFWDQALPSETSTIYRAEYLAFELLQTAERSEGALTLAALRDAARDGKLVELVRAFAADRHDEGYDRGVHDEDGAKILARLLTLQESSGLLRFAPEARALGQLFWEWYEDGDARRRWGIKAHSLGRLRRALGRGEALVALTRELVEPMRSFAAKTGLDAHHAELAASYLVEELTGEAHFTVSSDAEHLREALLRHLDVQGTRREFEADLEALRGDVRERLVLTRAWLEAFIGADPVRQARSTGVHEGAVMLASAGLSRASSSALIEAEVTGLLGQHPRLERGTLRLRIDEFLARVGGYVEHELP
ncbi:MAG: DNA repair ATPase, partial [Deltaproteobacteria bacterium]|nr:DNA repair ATPase [Deltaproteobacteria bacterium]